MTPIFSFITRWIFPFLVSWIFLSNISAQQILLHSHNDYRHNPPFYEAYTQKFNSIEADIFATDQEDELLVAHDAFELPEAPTLDESYIEPLVKLFRQNNGKAWKDSDMTLILLIDLKTSFDPTLDRLIKKLQQYSEVFDPTVNPFAVRVVISGSRPDPDNFEKYPPIISFDGEKTDYTPKQLERITMISLNLRHYTSWNGKGTIPEDDRSKVVETIEKVHALGKPIRFWGAPDGEIAWKTFYTIGIDYINTDTPEICADFFHKYLNKNSTLSE